MNLPGQQKDKFTPELRIIVAALLCMAVIFVWGKYFGPKPPTQQPQANRPAQTAPATPGSAAPTPATGSRATPSTPAAMAPAAPASVAAKSESQERTITIENTLYRVEISNRGAVVKSWQLKNYKDDAKPQRVLDVVHPDASQQTGGWPFALVLDDPEAQTAVNNGLYEVVSDGSSLHAPADAEFSWSDGHLEVTKHFHFEHSYVVRVETAVKLNGKPINAGLGWLGGFGDLTVTNPAPVETVSTYYSEGGKVTNFPHKKLEGIDKWSA
ncbi:MAG TPA: membrane protein insertase YidC, partial [Candidatus Acidoferrum sp.]|nr:membrane protein insertase YidC [Candidatus Acidoferrum sp.]